MKKFFMIAVMAVAALTASAQKGEYYVTPRINMGYDAMTNSDARGGILGGIGCNFEYMIADKFGISAGLDVNYLEGDKEKVTVGAQSAESSYNMGFLNIPVLANYHFGAFSVGAGVQPYFIISQKSKVVYTGPVTETDEISTTDGLNTFQFGIPVNLSYTFKTPITVGLNVTVPVTNLLNDDAVSAMSTVYGVKGKNTKYVPIVLTVGYRF